MWGWFSVRRVPHGGADRHPIGLVDDGNTRTGESGEPKLEGLGGRRRHHESQPAGAFGEVSDGPTGADREGAVRGRAQVQLLDPVCAIVWEAVLGRRYGLSAAAHPGASPHRWPETGAS